MKRTAGSFHYSLHKDTGRLALQTQVGRSRKAVGLPALEGAPGELNISYLDEAEKPSGGIRTTPTFVRETEATVMDVRA